MKKLLSTGLFAAVIGWAGATAQTAAVSSSISLKIAGNQSVAYALSDAGGGFLEADCDLPVVIRRQTSETGDGTRIVLTLTATEPIHYRIESLYRTEIPHEEALFYLPGFWYRRNLRSPQSAPSFHTSDSWQVREDRLSAPLTGVFDEKSGACCTVLRTDEFCGDALFSPQCGEVMLAGPTSVGFTGFRNVDGCTALVFGFPWSEAPKSYVRKLTLSPAIQAFEKLERGESRTWTWTIRRGMSASYSAFVADTWNRAFDALDPQPVEPRYTPEQAKAVLSEYFVQSYVDDYPLKYTSGVELRTADPASNGIAEIGFLGRVLLNAFNALEYGAATRNDRLVKQGEAIFDSYAREGFTPNGLFREVVDFQKGRETDIYSIRRQSEGAYAVLTYLAYEKRHGRSHPAWEKRLRVLLDRLLGLQNADGSFPRKFRDDSSVVDASGGSTPSATLPLTMAARYFGDDGYLKAARRTAAYLERTLISKADYFSSTLDADCEDKEAALYAATAMYYMARTTEGAERRHYVELCREAAYFALSWYYLWDVPFAAGQMLGEAGFRSRGWGNVSVENNHIDVFVFEFATVLDWLSEETAEPRFARMSAVIRSSMLQLMPTPEHNFCIGRTGYYPEVVQHTTWDYGKNGKGFYNDIFAPGWTVASLWQMLTPDRLENFFAN